jgi:hypothetical protein
MRMLSLMLWLVCFLVSPTMAAEPEAAAKPDYSNVTTLEAARALAAEGKLVKVLLFPAEFGGRDDAANTVYVPPGIDALKDQMTATLIRFYEQELIDDLSVKPEYKGKSVVPSKIVMTATHSTKDGKFNPTIDVW